MEIGSAFGANGVPARPGSARGRAVLALMFMVGLTSPLIDVANASAAPIDLRTQNLAIVAGSKEARQAASTYFSRLTVKCGQDYFLVNSRVSVTQLKSPSFVFQDGDVDDADRMNGISERYFVSLHPKFQRSRLDESYTVGDDFAPPGVIGTKDRNGDVRLFSSKRVPKFGPWSDWTTDCAPVTPCDNLPRIMLERRGGKWLYSNDALEKGGDFSPIDEIRQSNVPCDDPAVSQ